MHRSMRPNEMKNEVWRGSGRKNVYFFSTPTKRNLSGSGKKIFRRELKKFVHLNDENYSISKAILSFSCVRICLQA